MESQVAEAVMKAKREKLHTIRTALDSLRTLAANVSTVMIHNVPDELTNLLVDIHRWSTCLETSYVDVDHR